MHFLAKLKTAALVLTTIGLTCPLQCPAQPAATVESPGLSAEEPSEGPFVATDAGYMVAYEERISGTDVHFTMIPIAGGEFLLGSPAEETGRNDDEGPQVSVRVPPFWIGKCEVTWAEYQAFMSQYAAFKSLRSLRGDESAPEAVKQYLQQSQPQVDGVTSPTPLYDPETTYLAGDQPNQPAVTMTQFAAKQYTKWLSGITGRQYRLPAEAEWEYAARAGSMSAYSFGDNPEQLGEYGWFEANADYETHPVASKRPNAWGLFDIHGNVAEWVLDGYDPQHYSELAGETPESSDLVSWPTQLFPRSIRGGSWLDEAVACRSAARHQSDDPEWVLSDPNLPKSPWWFTEEPASGVGFRILRPLEPMDKETLEKVWEADVQRLRDDVADRLLEGRGARAAADSHLPQAIDAIREAGLVE